MPYLIDTDWMIDRLADVPEAVALLDALIDEGIAISVVTYMELREGALRGDDGERNEQRLNALLAGLPILSMSIAVARRCAAIRLTLRKASRRVNSRALDLVIAATAIEYDLSLVTRNRGDYSDIEGLKLYEAG